MKNKAKLFEIAKIAAQHSNGRLCLVCHEKGGEEKFLADAAHFLKLDGKRLGRDIELYSFMGNDITGWQQTLAMFLEEVVRPLKNILPKSYTKASESLRTFGESVYPKDLLPKWHDLF